MDRQRGRRKQSLFNNIIGEAMIQGEDDDENEGGEV